MDDIPGLLKDIDEIYVGKGTKVVHFDLRKDKPTDDELNSVLLGRSGTLRAPSMKAEKTLIVGFNEEMYRNVFG